MHLNKRQKIGTNKYCFIHAWIRKNYGKAPNCTSPNCTKISTTFQWALIKGKEYECKIENFMPLCRSCHAKYDMTPTTKKILREKNQYRVAKTCGKGHEYTPENTRYVNNGLWRLCLTCTREIKKRCWEKSRLNHVRVYKTHCKHGHEYTPENTYLRENRGFKDRTCRTCKYTNNKRHRAAKKQLT